MAEPVYSFQPPPWSISAVAPGTGIITPDWQRWFASLTLQFAWRWEDLCMPAVTLATTGAGTPPLRDSSTCMLNFLGNANCEQFGSLIMPRAWAPGTVIRPHVHLRFNTSAVANTRWEFAYDIANAGADFTNGAGAYTVLATITVANPQNTARHVYASFGDLTMTGFAEGAAMYWRLKRPAVADAADTDANATQLISIGWLYRVEKWGTMS